MVETTLISPDHKAGGKTQSLPPAITLKGINKSFGAVHANRDIDLKVDQGTIHGIIGENGAGKSTLMSILYGFYQADTGKIEVFGQPATIQNSDDAIARGIGMVHQHFMLVETFTVLENVILGAEDGHLLNKSLGKARRVLEGLETDYGLKVDLGAVVERLPVGERQRVEILKALFRGARILILDEPTGVLTPQETDQLFRILESLKAQGVTILLITHKLQEIMAITDNVSVMRGGEMVAHLKTRDTNKQDLAELMVGRKVRLDIDKEPAVPGAPMLQARNLSYRDGEGVERVKGLSFDVKAGEIVGVAGVSGNGQSDLLELLAGIKSPSGGSFFVKDREISPQSPCKPNEMRAMGLAHIPEDRHRLGLVKRFAAYETAMLGYQDDPAFSKRYLLDPIKIKDHCLGLMSTYDVRPPNPELKSANFSGGNQQKLIIARELERNPDIILVGQPTRGVDIGAIEFIHRQLLQMRDAGCAILLVSVELEEIMSLSDRILVMCGGRITGQLDAQEADARTLGMLMGSTDEGEADTQINRAEAVI